MELFTGLLADATAHLPETPAMGHAITSGAAGAVGDGEQRVCSFIANPARQMLPTELDRLVRETVDFLLPLARQRGPASQDRKPPRETFDACRCATGCKQVFLNLVAERISRYAAWAGNCNVRLRWAPQFPGGVVQIDFQDDGRGVAPELLERIYEPGIYDHAGQPGTGSRGMQESDRTARRRNSREEQAAAGRPRFPISSGITRRAES